MGLFDGRLGPTEQASTAEVAKLLGAPVLLVLDVARMSRSAAALAWGFARFDPALQVAGVVLNNLGSERHRQAVAPSVEQEAGLPVLGTLPRDPALRLPERHLGLVPATEGPSVAVGFLNSGWSVAMVRYLPSGPLPYLLLPSAVSR